MDEPGGDVLGERRNHRQVSAGRGENHMPIDFTPTAAQEELRNNARTFAAAVLAPLAEELADIADPVESFTRTRGAYREMAKAGFTKSYIPVADGGLGFGMIDFAIAAEELTRVDVNVPTTLLGTGLALQPVIQFGTLAQRKRFLAPSSTTAMARSWPRLRSPTSAAAPTTTAMIRAPGYRPWHSARGTRGSA